MNVVAFNPAGALVDAAEQPRLSAGHLQILAEALDFRTDVDVVGVANIDTNTDDGSRDSPSDSTPAASANDDTLANRNYMATTPGTPAAAQVAQLVNMGLMECAAGPLWRGQYVHVVTQAGRDLIQQFRRAMTAPR